MQKWIYLNGQVVNLNSVSSIVFNEMNATAFIISIHINSDDKNTMYIVYKKELSDSDFDAVKNSLKEKVISFLESNEAVLTLK